MPEPRLQIRRARWPEDEAAVMALFHQCDLYHATLIPTEFRPFTQDLAFFRQRVSHPDGVILCALLDQKIVGCVYLHPRAAPPYPMCCPHRYVTIDNLVVHRAHRRKGVGTALMHAVEDEAAAMGIQDVRLHVWEANEAALRFYEHLGYQTLSRNMVKRSNPTNKGDRDE